MVRINDMSTSLRVIFAGTSNFAVQHLNILLSSGHEIVGVFTQPDRPAGRGKKIMSSPVKILAKREGIPVFQPISLNFQESRQLIADLNADIMVVVAYGLFLSEMILNIPRFGCINVHGSLLPRWRGAAPIQRSLLAGDAETGITIIKMNIELDAGDILYRASCPILDNDTSATLCSKLIKLGQEGLIKVLKQISEKHLIQGECQDKSLVTYAKKINKNEARINWSLSADQLERCVRAFNPWPMSWIEVNKKPIKILQASVIPISMNIEPRTIIKVNKQGIQIATAKNALNLELLQPAGKKPMYAQDFLNSRYNWFIPGTRLN